MTIKKDNDQINKVPGSEEKPADEKGQGGEDDGSTEIDGDDSHLHEDQKSRTLKD